jgi:hypothetical protein
LGKISPYSRDIYGAAVKTLQGTGKDPKSDLKTPLQAGC